MLRLEDVKHVKQSSETGCWSLVATSVTGRDQGAVTGHDTYRGSRPAHCRGSRRACCIGT